jgi:hypothetical protein
VGKGYLTRSGKYTAELFRNVLHDEGERRVRRCRAANILSRFQTNDARKALTDGLSIADRTVRTAVLEGLLKGDFELESRTLEEMIKLLRIEIHDAKSILKSVVALIPEPHSARMIDALNQEIGSNRKRTLILLGLISGRRMDVMTPLLYWYIRVDDEAVPPRTARGLARLLETLPDEALRENVRSLLLYRDTTAIRDTFKKAGRRPRTEVENHLKRIAFTSTLYSLSWSRICALEMIVRLNLTGAVPGVVECLKEADDILRATAVWALFRLDRKTFSDMAPRLKGDRNHLVAKTAQQLAA